MLTSIQGYYHNGMIQLDELPPGINETQVIVTFLSKYAIESKTKQLDKDFSKLLAALEQFPADFMSSGREQPLLQEREFLF